MAVGLGYRGIVVPLAARIWPNNTTLAEGTFWAHLISTLAEVHGRLPSVLQNHIVLVADRAFGIPRMVDLANTFNWAWVLRIQGLVQVRLPNGEIVPVRTLADHPGAVWFGGFGQATLEDCDVETPTVAVFKSAGWRSCQVIAVWDPIADEPWLLITNLPASRKQVHAYARRWAIERTFLSWKSHGWDLETLQLRTIARIGRLVAGLAIATLWCLLIGTPHTDDLLDDLTARAQQRPTAVYQQWLPGLGPARPDHRPYPAHFSLFSWGRKVIEVTPCHRQTPPFYLTLPHWQAPIWSIQCIEAAGHVA